MFEQNIISISPDLVNLLLVLAFSLVIGLELRQNFIDAKVGTLFGTDRTHAFIGLLGYVLYILSGEHHILYMAGGIAILILLSIYYKYKIIDKKQYGITSILVALITYTIPALLYTKPLWLTISIVAIILVITELKKFFWKLSRKFSEDEFITLSKFLLISGVVLPLLSNHPISKFIPVSPFKIWASVVVISGISYISYIVKNYVIPGKGAFVTGILGGIYSSTATSVVLAKKSKYSNKNLNRIASAIILATAMMFVRVWVLALIFNKEAGRALAIPLLSLALVSAVIAWIIYKNKRAETDDASGQEFQETEVKNPLEFKTALLFAFLFLVFSLITEYVLKWYGHQGLHILSFIVGVTDIDPFLLSLFSGKYAIDVQMLTRATLIAISSNNLMKLGYVYSLGNPKMRKNIVMGFLAIVLISLVFILM